MSRRNAPSVNSGSMADIAFLLLIFFLLTTTISAEKGIKRQLPKPCPTAQDCVQTIEEPNLLKIVTNLNSELMVNDLMVSVDELEEIVKNFVDNNSEGSCDYCHGLQIRESSEHPKKAHIALQVHPKTKYSVYIAIQDQITAAYFELRDKYIKTTFQSDFGALSQSQIKRARKAYPFNLIEVPFRQ
ncbi:MAG: biopolymer transporter ExbD [Bacteroidota bacterium]